LYQKVSQLQIEVDWLKKRSTKLSNDELVEGGTMPIPDWFFTLMILTFAKGFD